jgi:hypothetical protein
LGRAMSKADEKRAAIIAKQAAREVTERAAQQVSGTETSRPVRGRWRSNFTSSTPFAGGRRGRPPKT